MNPKTELLERTLAAARKDKAVARNMPEIVPGAIEGAWQRRIPGIQDDRGALQEIWRTDWDSEEPKVSQVYYSAFRPKTVKGWALHKTHDDRYFLVSGKIQVVLFDVRPESPTFGVLSTVDLSGQNGAVLNIPANVWHADVNFENSEAVLINMPTRAFDYDDPDKFRLPIDSPLIPHSFDEDLTGY